MYQPHARRIFSQQGQERRHPAVQGRMYEQQDEQHDEERRKRL